ncbi:MAG: diaminopimelate decarboxylase [Pseudomonadota bacterium]
MDYFQYQDDQLMVENLAVQILAEQYGTPLYVYSSATITRHWQAFDQAFASYPHLVCYAVKANSNLSILRHLAHMGSGFDIVSGGELARVLKAGGDPQKIVFSGVGKSAVEIEAALTANIFCFNVESSAELKRIEQIARHLKCRAPISIRVNPDVDAATHPYISTGLKENKFGVAIEQSMELFKHAAQSDALNAIGIDCHIGSQLTQLTPFLDALDKVIDQIEYLASEGIQLSHLDIGGGLGVRYNQENPPEPAVYAESILRRLRQRLPNHSLKILIEPGRAIMANAGILVTKVEYLKQNMDRHFALVDAAMNDLLRPSLYNAWHDIIPVNLKNHPEAMKAVYDIVGPVCETGDFLGKERTLSLKEGDLLAVRSAGAYGFSMSSNYNSRSRCAEILVDNSQHQIIRRRETIEDLFVHELDL